MKAAHKSNTKTVRLRHQHRGAHTNDSKPNQHEVLRHSIQEVRIYTDEVRCCLKVK